MVIGALFLKIDTLLIYINADDKQEEIDGKVKLFEIK